jgi:putative molybdopterin biosynthesis protein
MRQLMSTKEIAEYLRLKERKIYDLVSRNEIPHSRVSGKLLFPRAQIDDWVGRNMGGAPARSIARSAPVIAGSHDPLLDWAVRESRCGLAVLTYGSLDGIDRMLSGEASAAAIHLPPTKGSDRNMSVASERLGHLDVALVKWASREQGLVVASGNPLKIKSLNDLLKKKARVIPRQPHAGSYLLLLELLGQARMKLTDLNMVKFAALSESDIASAILDGKADAGLAIRAVARQFHLDFVPLATEELDLIVSRRAYFEAPMQALLAFTRTTTFRQYARELSGYDVSELGKVVWNA